MGIRLVGLQRTITAVTIAATTACITRSCSTLRHQHPHNRQRRWQRILLMARKNMRNSTSEEEEPAAITLRALPTNLPLSRPLAPRRRRGDCSFCRRQMIVVLLLVVKALYLTGTVVVVAGAAVDPRSPQLSAYAPFLFWGGSGAGMLQNAACDGGNASNRFE